MRTAQGPIAAAVPAAATAAASAGRLLEARAGLAHERDGLGEDDRHHAADLVRLLLGRALDVDAVDRRHRQVDGELDRVVGPRQSLRALHLVRELRHAALELVRIAEKSSESFHPQDATPRPRSGSARDLSGGAERAATVYAAGVSELQRIEGAGVELAVEARGAGTPVLLVHDLAADRRSLAPLAAALAGGGDAGAGAGARRAPAARAIAYDRRGYGDSGAPEPYERTTVQEQAQDALALLQALGAGGDAVALGDGFGALIVLDLLVRLPGLLRGAVLVAPPLNQLSDAAAAVLSEQRQRLEAALRDDGPAGAVAAWRPDADAGVRAAHRAFFADFGGLASWPVARRELRAVAVPVAVVTGAASPPHLVAAADALAALLGDGRRVRDGDPLPPLRALLAGR